MSAVGDYLDRAAAAGLMERVLGYRYVADRYDDPVSGLPQCLVEYCDPALLRHTAALDALRARLREQHPAAGTVLLRVADATLLPAPWAPRLTYLRHHRSTPATQPSASATLTVRPATPADDGRVHRWLVEALRSAYPGHDVAPEHTGIEAIMADPGRLSFIAEVAGAPVGHATVLADERDEVTGEPFAELVDILVEPEAHRRAATGALVAAAATATEGRPLCGQVIHPHPSGPADGPGAERHADAVVETLLRGDWSIDHRFWTCPS
jgi:hypothetical protein